MPAVQLPGDVVPLLAELAKPYPVRVETGTNVGSVDFLDYGRPVRIIAPPAAQVAEFEALPTS